MKKTGLSISRIAALALVAAALLAYGLDGNSRMYWPYMALAYFMGVFAWLLEFENTPRAQRPPLARYLFPREVWLHPSSINDCFVALINLGLILTVFHLPVLDPDFFRRAVVGLAARPEAAGAKAPGAAVALYALLALLLSELFYYISHRLTHTVPALWEFHKVHHSAKVMTPLTLYRMHPVDFWLNEAARAAGLGIAAAAFLAVYPSPADLTTVAAVNLGVYLSALAAANLRHSHIWLSFGPGVERFILSPAQHQVHHSEDPRHFNSNYGSLLGVWDWAFGSLYIPKGREKITFGLGGEKMEAPYRTVFGMYAAPFARLFGRRE